MCEFKGRKEYNIYQASMLFNIIHIYSILHHKGRLIMCDSVVYFVNQLFYVNFILNLMLLDTNIFMQEDSYKKII